MANSPFKKWPPLIEKAIDELLPMETERPCSLHNAMRYTALGGGKRLRGVLALAVVEAVGGKAEPIMPAAVAVELVHSYSLIHDDLPCLDNDALRRGKAANHIVFGEALALLAGDALLTEAFFILTRLEEANVPSSLVMQAVKILSAAAGSQGMVAGQVEDIANIGTVDLATLDWINDRKTGALITASLLIGGVLGGGTKVDLNNLQSYGEKIGRAFQIIDDLLDVVGSTENMGKHCGSDRAAGKVTYPNILGVDKAKQVAVQLIGEAKAALSNLSGDITSLLDIAEFIIARDR